MKPRAMRAPIDRLMEKATVNPATGCWEWTASKRGNGYGSFRVGRKTTTAHRASYELHCGPIPEGRQICHKCDNRICINPNHLFVGTHMDNMADKVAKGRVPSGEMNGYSKLTEADVVAIRSSQGATLKELAAQYGVHFSCISRVRRAETWRQTGDHELAQEVISRQVRK